MLVVPPDEGGGSTSRIDNGSSFVDSFIHSFIHSFNAQIQGFGKAAMSWYIDGRSGEQNTAEEFSSEEEWEFFITCVLARLNELEDSASKRYVGMEVILPKA